MLDINKPITLHLVDGCMVTWHRILNIVAKEKETSVVFFRKQLSCPILINTMTVSFQRTCLWPYDRRLKTAGAVAHINVKYFLIPLKRSKQGLLVSPLLFSL